MTFYADLHVHSKYSRATSRDGDLEHLAYWGKKKGMAVVATGDFTHPRWFEEIGEKLVPAEPGLFRLRPDLEREIDAWPQAAPGPAVRFMLEVEISTIYKKDDRTRKVHHLIYAPDLEKAERLRRALDRIGNVASDGRPILGLDSRDLLEITLECGDGCYLVPAHIWTPWFAVLGSKSGFDAVDDCYGDLASAIFSVETGLSSDPPMNWRLSGLDRYTLVSNSDAHSPPKIGRECCVFHTELDYFAMRQALETGERYGGTVEFFPEEGKYHLDGHRKCGVCLAPGETRKHDGLCPACGKPITLGVMHRVEELADRAEQADASPPKKAPFRSLVPLEEVLAEILGVGSGTKTVRQRYEDLVARLGPELFILEHASLEDLRRAGSSLLAEALGRMREGRVIRRAGYDGEYGTIRLFSDDEIRRGGALGLLFEMPQDEPPPVQASVAKRERAGDRDRRLRVDSPDTTPSEPQAPAAPAAADSGILGRLDPEQRAAAEIAEGPLLIVAGPGTGKTRTLTHRIAHLIADRGAAPEQCLAITFTRRAAAEMTERLETLVPDRAERIAVMTFHALGLSMLREHGARLGLPQPVRVASRAECVEGLAGALPTSRRRAAQLLATIARRKRQGEASATGEPPTDAETLAAERVYEEELRRRGLVDFDDLVILPVRLLDECPDLIEAYRSRYRWIAVDEYQDVDPLQYGLIRRLAPPGANLCVIGDPDQAIYGFRGGDVGHFARFADDYPSAKTVALVRNYRSTRTIVDAAGQLVAPSSLVADRRLTAHVEGLDQIEIHECSTERAEAEFVVHAVERMIGGSTFFSMDSGRVENGDGEARSFSDFAVLYRTEAQSDALVEAFGRSGMPFQKRSHDALADRPGVPALLRAIEAQPGDRGVPDRLERALAQVDEQEEPLAGRGTVDRDGTGDRSARRGLVEESLPALRLLARRHEHDLARFLSEVALGVDVDFWDPRADRVALLTLHASKGLEFPVVFIVGCEDGLIPLHWGSATEADLAEERRLLFVGVTRAQSRLLLTHARKRRWRGAIRPRAISPFVRDIEQQLLARHQHRPTKRPAEPSSQPTLFEI